LDIRGSAAAFTAMTSDWNTVARFVLPLRELKCVLLPSDFFSIYAPAQDFSPLRDPSV
jgi:hypothetical protein